MTLTRMATLLIIGAVIGNGIGIGLLFLWMKIEERLNR